MADAVAVARRPEARFRGNLDGARIWNASAATGVSVAEFVRPFDTVSVCFSKGLGVRRLRALRLEEAFVDEARFFRKRWGGGMRQSGVPPRARLRARAPSRAPARGPLQ